MIVVTGCPRSGTSMMMDILRNGLGVAHTIGHDIVPSKDELKKAEEHVLAKGNPIEIYEFGKNGPKRTERIMRSTCMNPNGFYECAYSVRGVFWSVSVADLYERVANSNDRDFIKIVSSGLVNTQPEFIHRIIWMLRDPRAVAKSQEQLGGFVRGDLKDKVHNPLFFIKSNVTAANYLQKFKVPYKVVVYEDLIAEPMSTISQLADFLEVDFDSEKAATVIDPELKRSTPQDVDCDTWEEAERVYDMVKNRELDALVEYGQDRSTIAQRHITGFMCHRLGMKVSGVQCEHCRTSQEVRSNFKKRAESTGVDWRNEPCAYECGRDPLKNPISIEESVNCNFWDDQKETSSTEDA